MKLFKKSKQDKINIKKQELIGNTNPEKINKIKQEIEELENGTYQKCLEEELKKITEEIKTMELEEQLIGVDKIINNRFHQIIIEHLRNALVHGNVTFPNGFDFNNLGSTIIRFQDYDGSILTFDATINIEDLLIELNEEKFLLSIFPKEIITDINKKRNV